MAGSTGASDSLYIRTITSFPTCRFRAGSKSKALYQESITRQTTESSGGITRPEQKNGPQDRGEGYTEKKGRRGIRIENKQGLERRFGLGHENGASKEDKFDNGLVFNTMIGFRPRGKCSGEP